MFTVIIVTAIFYIPFHVGPPVLLSLLYGRDAEQRKIYVKQILLESTVTMLVSLTAFFILWQTQLGVAITVMLVMMAIPYFRVWRFKKQGER
jgi:cadmium resistance protein CadD (predicted permease)